MLTQDLLRHTLTLVAVKAFLATRLAERDPAAARREMEHVAAIARETLTEIRSAVTGTRRASLAADIGRSNEMLAATRMDAHLLADHGGLDPSGEAVLAMALREAVTNVIRHSGATRVHDRCWR